MSSMPDCQHSFPAESTLCLQFESVLKSFQFIFLCLFAFLMLLLGWIFVLFYLLLFYSAAVHKIQFNPKIPFKEENAFLSVVAFGCCLFHTKREPFTNCVQNYKHTAIKRQFLS